MNLGKENEMQEFKESLSQLDKGLLYTMRFPIQHLIACNRLRVPAFPRSNIPICTYLPLGVPLSLRAGRCL